LFSELGVNLTVLNKEKDPSFRGKLPNPLIENLADLKEYVLKNKCDFGFACDSDADRLGVIDEQGNYVSANEILAIIYYYLVKYEG
ncbi:phosphoglucomutase/phosphomannomutase family protein, partial [Xanthomonas citri pv. citri]|nr:phosphoglucomutase/phosphomannomutase family protein [Xanthomonas citri pv. citri]